MEAIVQDCTVVELHLGRSPMLMMFLGVLSALRGPTAALLLHKALLCW